MITEEEHVRIDRIFREASGADHPKNVGLRIYPDDALFLLVLLDRLNKKLKEVQANGNDPHL